MRGMSGKSDSGTITGRVIHEARSAPRRLTGPLGKLMKALTEATDSVSFDAREFAFLLSLCSVPMQRGFLDIVVAYVSFLSEKHQTGLWADGDEHLLVQDGHAISQAVSFLRD